MDAPNPAFSTAQAQPVFQSARGVYLNVYDVVVPSSSGTDVPVASTVITSINKLGRTWGVGGVFHGAIQIDNFEWSFGFCERGSGVYCVHARENPMYQFRETIDLGPTMKPKAEIKSILHNLKNEWQGKTYDLLSRNCCHFCEAFCTELGVKPIPAWVNRFATGADATVNFTQDAVAMAKNVTHSIRNSAASSLGWLRDSVGRMMQRSSLNGTTDSISSTSSPGLLQHAPDPSQSSTITEASNTSRRTASKGQSGITKHTSMLQREAVQGNGHSSPTHAAATLHRNGSLGVQLSACSEGRVGSNMTGSDATISSGECGNVHVSNHLRLLLSGRSRPCSSSGAVQVPGTSKGHGAARRKSGRACSELGLNGNGTSDAETPIFSRTAVAGVLAHREGMVGGQLDSDSCSCSDGEEETPKCLSRQACLDFSQYSSSEQHAVEDPQAEQLCCVGSHDLLDRSWQPHSRNGRPPRPGQRQGQGHASLLDTGGGLGAGPGEELALQQRRSEALSHAAVWSPLTTYPDDVHSSRGSQEQGSERRLQVATSGASGRRAGTGQGGSSREPSGSGSDGQPYTPPGFETGST